MRTAHDIMTPKLKMILSSDSLEDVIKTYLEQGITTSPVMTPQQEPLGMLSELKLAKAYMIHRSKNQAAGKVGNHLDMLDPITTVDEEAPLSDVLREMINSTTHRVLVKNKKGTLVGIISPKDMMRAMIGVAIQLKISKTSLKKLKISFEKHFVK
ncbi:MAG: HPP family protein [Bdellovibrionales bacterium]